jgi:hypothetical protein
MLRILRNVVFVAWALGATALVAATVFYASIFFAINPTPWNFPGDPPLFELLIWSGGVLALVCLPLWSLCRKFLPRLAPVPKCGSIVSLAMIAVAILGILERHDGRWAAVRNGIRTYGDRIGAAAGDRRKTLSDEEYEHLKRTIMPNPVPVSLPGYGTVNLRMAHGNYPYVGADFGNGANAFFDPSTMICTYSD